VADGPVRAARDQAVVLLDGHFGAVHSAQCEARPEDQDNAESDAHQARPLSQWLSRHGAEAVPVPEREEDQPDEQERHNGEADVGLSPQQLGRVASRTLDPS
jgi:hypothetical protein